MSAKEVLHIITDDEIGQIVALGFEITGGIVPLVKFLNEYFARFHIGEYLTALEDLLSELTHAVI